MVIVFVQRKLVMPEKTLCGENTAKSLRQHHATTLYSRPKKRTPKKNSADPLRARKHRLSSV